MAANEVENGMKIREGYGVIRNRLKSMKKQKILPRFGCLRLDDESPTVDKKIDDGGIDMVSAGALNDRCDPTHLIVMVNGIIGRLFHPSLLFIIIVIVVV